MSKKDNSTFRRKVSLRLAALKELDAPRVVETHGGCGLLFGRCYGYLDSGVVFEKDDRKVSILARQRPTWAVYQGDCEHALEAGVGFHHEPNYFDIDPYGEPWPVIDAIFAGLKDWPPRLVMVVNDGLRQKLRLQGGWTVESLNEIVQARGNRDLHNEYLDVCRDLVSRKASAAGYDLRKWTGYYCGWQSEMTHYAAVLELGTPG